MLSVGPEDFLPRALCQASLLLDSPLDPILLCVFGFA